MPSWKALFKKRKTEIFVLSCKTQQQYKVKNTLTMHWMCRVSGIGRGVAKDYVLQGASLQHTRGLSPSLSALKPGIWLHFTPTTWCGSEGKVPCTLWETVQNIVLCTTLAMPLCRALYILLMLFLLQLSGISIKGIDKGVPHRLLF